MKIDVRIKVDLDLGAFAEEYGVDAAEALVMALRDLRQHGNYLTGEKWTGLATIDDVAADFDLNQRRTPRRPATMRTTATDPDV
jgi:hypothetical protein